MVIRKTTRNRHIGGAAIVEMLIAVPLVFVFLAGTVEVGRLINQGAYLKVMTFNAAMVGAGISNLSGAEATIERANNQYLDNTSVRQVSVPQFQADFDDQRRIIRVDYGANLHSIFPQNLTIGGMRGKISLPYLSSSQSTGLDDEPTNDARGEFCYDGTTKASWGCGPKPETPCSDGPWKVYCGNNPDCVPVARTKIDKGLSTKSSASNQITLNNCARLKIPVDDATRIDVEIPIESVSEDQAIPFNGIDG